MKKYLLSAMFILLSFMVLGSDLDHFFNSRATQVNFRSGVYSDDDYTYYQGGGVRAYNPPAVTIQPINIQPPSISAGCSGIDLQMGGVNFASEKKYENFAKDTLRKAPYIVAQMAIKALSSETADTIAEFQAMVDRLNSLQMDSCAAAQGLVTTTVALTTDTASQVDSAKKTAKKMYDGIGGAFTDFFNSANSSATNLLKGDSSNDFFVQGSLLDKIWAKTELKNAGYDLNEIRGVLGDYVLSLELMTDTGYEALNKQYYNSCGALAGNSFDNVYTRPFINNKFGNCTKMTPPPLADVSNVILNNTAMSQPVHSFLNALRVFSDFYPYTVQLALNSQYNTKMQIGRAIDSKYEDVEQDFPYLVAYVDADALYKYLVQYSFKFEESANAFTKNTDKYKQYLIMLDNYSKHIFSIASNAQIKLEKLKEERKKKADEVAKAKIDTTKKP